MKNLYFPPPYGRGVGGIIYYLLSKLELILKREKNVPRTLIAFAFCHFSLLSFVDETILHEVASKTMLEQNLKKKGVVSFKNHLKNELHFA